MLSGVSRVLRVKLCALRGEAGRWEFAETHRKEIARNWEHARGENAGYFNGTIYLMRAHRVKGDVLIASFIETDFKSYLLWRERGFPDARVWDGFGSALVRSCEGHAILGRQGAGHVNSGLAYLPGGFIDARDVGDDGTIDIDASIARELFEETGLEAAKLSRSPGYLVTYSGAQVSIAVEFRSQAPAALLRDQIEGHLSRDQDPELCDVVVCSRAPRHGAEGIAPYASVLLGAVLPGLED